MGTWGMAWLPEKPNDAASKMLRCQAWASGFPEEFGVMMLVSSHMIEGLSIGAVATAGQQFCAMPESPGVLPFDEWQLEDVAEDVDEEEFPDVCSAMDRLEETTDLLAQGDFSKAAETAAARIPTERKLAAGMGSNTVLEDHAEAWKMFVESGWHVGSEERSRFEGKLELLSGEDATDWILNAKTKFVEVCGANDFMWLDGEFVGLAWAFKTKKDAENGLAAEMAVVPLITLLAITWSGNLGLGDGDKLLDKYLRNPTSKDAVNLSSTMSRAKAKGLGAADLFGGRFLSTVQALMAEVEKKEISASTEQGKVTQRKPGL